jgi:RNA polymerase sigma-70 factor, ECF subfamily
MSDEFAKHLEEQIPRLRRYAHALARNTERANDLVQDTLLRAWSRRDRLPTGEHFIFVLFKICHDTWADQIHRAVLERQWAENTAAVTERNHGQDIFGRLELRDVALAFAKLPEQSREVLHLAAVERMRYREISTILGIDETVVSSRLHRARQQLRNALGERDRRETKKKVTAEERGRIIERLSALRDASAVAREFRRNPNVTWRIARQAGIELTAGYAIRGYRGSGAARRLTPSGP